MRLTFSLRAKASGVAQEIAFGTSMNRRTERVVSAADGTSVV